MKYGIPYLLLSLLFFLISNHIQSGYEFVKNDLILNLVGSLGSVFGSFMLAGILIGYKYLERRKFPGFKNWNLITLIISIFSIGWQFYSIYSK